MVTPQVHPKVNHTAYYLFIHSCLTGMKMGWCGSSVWQVVRHSEYLRQAIAVDIQQVVYIGSWEAKTVSSIYPVTYLGFEGWGWGVHKKNVYKNFNHTH